MNDYELCDNKQERLDNVVIFRYLFRQKEEVMRCRKIIRTLS